MKSKIGMEVRANGKINLYLDVLSKESNGFHNIKSIMQSVSLSDVLIISAARSYKTEIRITCNLQYVPCDEKNIAYRAATLFLERAKLSAEVDIKLNKRIPVAGGMAGGSTDAAATLIALNKLFGGVFNNRELCAIGAELGSDIPFCMVGRTALCEGRGEIVTQIKNNAKLKLLIVPSNESVSTPLAYCALDERFGDFSGREKESTERYQKLTVALETGDAKAISENIYNIFEEVILPERPLAKRAKELLVENGAVGAMMSGSGPTVFGIFDSDEAREGAIKALREKGYSPKTAESII